MTTNKDILDAVTRVSEQVSRVDEKADRTNARLDTVVGRMDTLVDTTNHRLDDFTEALAEKQDKSSLLSSVGFKIAQNKVARWILAVGFAAFAATATYQHWLGLLENLVGR